MAYQITEGCNGCTLCKKLCPVEAIKGETKVLHVIDSKRCIECGVCGRGCTQGAVIDSSGAAISKVPRKQWPIPVINQAECTACGVCIAACSKNGLAISEPAYKGDLLVFAYLNNEKSCVGCGICSKECPIGAIQMQIPVSIS